MPLSRLRPGDNPPYPKSEDVMPMLHKLKFREEHRKAFQQVFRKCLVVRTLEVGAKFAKSHELDCITLEGDQVNRKGALTGGYMDVRRSRLQSQADIVAHTEMAAKTAAQLDELTKQGDKIDEEVTALLGEIAKVQKEKSKADNAKESEEMDLKGGSTAASRRAADAQKESMLASLRSSIDADTAKLDDVTREIGSAFTDGLTAAEQTEREGLQDSTKALNKARVAGESALAKAEAERSSLESELHEHLHKRQAELHEQIEALGDAEEHAEEEGDRKKALAAQKEKLKSLKKEIARVGSEQDDGRDAAARAAEVAEELKSKLADAKKQAASEEKELDRLLSRKTMLQAKLDDYNAHKAKLGSLPMDAFDESHAKLSSKQLEATIKECQQALQKLGHVNKKALDQFANFSDQREKLVKRQQELDEAETSIKSLMSHLDVKKGEAVERTFKGVAKHFSEVWKEMVPGGWGKLIMQISDQPAEGDAAAGGSQDAASRVARYTGVVIKVQFVGGGEAQTMQQLSGGQKTMVALCLIFAIQRCDPAPFYIFDEIDANLDAAHRNSLAKMIARQAADDDEARAPTQFISTTFRPELVHAGNRFYGVTHRNKVSTVKSIEKEEALRIIAEDSNRLRQHAGSSSRASGRASQ